MKEHQPTVEDGVEKHNSELIIIHWMNITIAQQILALVLECRVNQDIPDKTLEKYTNPANPVRNFCMQKLAVPPWMESNCATELNCFIFLFG